MLRHLTIPKNRRVASRRQRGHGPAPRASRLPGPKRVRGRAPRIERRRVRDEWVKQATSERSGGPPSVLAHYFSEGKPSCETARRPYSGRGASRAVVVSIVRALRARWAGQARARLKAQPPKFSSAASCSGFRRDHLGDPSWDRRSPSCDRRSRLARRLQDRLRCAGAFQSACAVL